MLAPITKSMTVATPGGLTSTTTGSRTATLTNPDDPLSLTGLTDTVTVNGRIYTSVYSSATKTSTNTLPSGRKTYTTIDAQGRVASEQTAEGQNRDSDYFYLTGKSDNDRRLSCRGSQEP